MSASIASAYDATAGAWERSAGRVYNHLAAVVIGHAAVPLTGRVVLDVGAGTGAASRVLASCGAYPIALDVAFGVLAAGADRRPPAVVADALELPLPGDSVDGAVACFSLNHVERPSAALAELGRACRPGSPIIASAYATDDGHPVKAAVERVLVDHGWQAPSWYTAMRRDTIPLLATTERATAAARDAGLDVDARHVEVSMAWLAPSDLVEWRFGMAHVAPFLSGLRARERERLRQRILGELGDDPPPLRRSLVVISAIV